MSVTHLTLRQLRAVSTIYATRRISAAAERLNITQSAASVLLGQAEAALGSRLFDRTTRSLTPTDAVEQVIGIVDRILADLEALGSVMTDLQALERGRVRLAATPATGMALLPTTVRRFRAAYPAVTLVLDDCAPNQFFSVIREEKVDFGIGARPPNDSEFDWTVLHQDPLYLVCHQDHPLAQAPTVAWRQLHGESLILSRRDYGVHNLVMQTLQEQGVRLTLAAEVGFLISAAWMATCGIGLCILPGHLVRSINDPLVRSVPLVDPVVTRPVGIVGKRGRSLPPSGQRFVGMLAEDLADTA